MYVTFAATSMIPQLVTPTTALSQALHSKNSPKTGSAPSAVLERMNSALLTNKIIQTNKFAQPNFHLAAQIFSIQTFEKLGNSFEISIAALAGIAAVGSTVAVAIGAEITQFDTTPDESGRKPLDLHPSVNTMDLHNVAHLGTIIVDGILAKEVVHFLFLLLSQFVESEALLIIK